MHEETRRGLRRDANRCLAIMLLVAAVNGAFGLLDHRIFNLLVALAALVCAALVLRDLRVLRVITVAVSLCTAATFGAESVPDYRGHVLTYSTAYKVHRQYGRPMIVIVGAKWCPHCQTKKAQLPGFAARNPNTVVCYVDYDEDLGNALQLLNGRTAIPRTVVFAAPKGKR